MVEGAAPTQHVRPVRHDDRVSLAEYLSECRDLATDEIKRLFGGTDQHHRVLYDLILDYPLREGKALRPTLAIATCRALGGHLEAVLPTAATLELSHNAFLIHDDIEDDSLMRRGEPTLHVDHGVPIAVNVGDAMLVLSLKPLLDNTEIIGLGPALRILALVAHMSQESVEGQAVELAWVRENRWDLGDADYVDMVIQKTGWYSFITPIQVGAIVAGTSVDRVESLLPFATELSVAFQITDDVLNLRARPEAYGKEIGGDLWEGKRTIMLIHAVRSASRADAERAMAILAKDRPSSDGDDEFATLLGELERSGDLSASARTRIEAFASAAARPVKTADDVDWLFDLIHRHGSLDYAADLARRHARNASQLLEELDWIPPSRHRQVLEELVAYVHERHK